MNIIDDKTGYFYLGNDKIIKPGQTIETILKFDLENTVWDVKTGYKWIRYRNLELDGLYFFVAICVYHDLVTGISFSFYNEKQAPNPSWDDWSEVNELKNRDRYEQWLTDQFGQRREFSWGTLSAQYDRKGGSSGMMLWYN